VVDPDGAVTSYKRLFSRALNAPGRLHMAAHSHHLWPDVTRDAQLQAWEDGARLADRKWDKVMGEVLPEAQAHVAGELGLLSPASIVFAPNTHELFVRLVSAWPKRPVRVLSTDAEFHSFRRQAARWVESGQIALERLSADSEDFEEQLLARAGSGDIDLVFVSQIFFSNGRPFRRLAELCALARPEGPWIVVDGYHGFMAVPTDLGALGEQAFYLAGGYKYAMTGEGAAFMHAPPGYGARPAITGWFAEFANLTGPPGAVQYPEDASRFIGSTFDPSALYRLNSVFRLLEKESLTTAAISARVTTLLDDLRARIDAGEAGRLASATLLNPSTEAPRARFLAYRHPQAALWASVLSDAGVIVDLRGHVIRIGMGLYHDPEDVQAFCQRCREVLA
jgi:selenocysteine lyase/cysteine desulfurase